MKQGNLTIEQFTDFGRDKSLGDLSISDKFDANLQTIYTHVKSIIKLFNEDKNLNTNKLINKNISGIISYLYTEKTSNDLGKRSKIENIDTFENNPIRMKKNNLGFLVLTESNINQISSLKTYKDYFITYFPCSEFINGLDYTHLDKLKRFGIPLFAKEQLIQDITRNSKIIKPLDYSSNLEWNITSEGKLDGKIHTY